MIPHIIGWRDQFGFYRLYLIDICQILINGSRKLKCCTQEYYFGAWNMEQGMNNYKYFQLFPKIMIGTHLNGFVKRI